MPPRQRPAREEYFHPNADPGVAGCRTGIVPPQDVRRGSNGFERFSDYDPSPNKVSPIKQLSLAKQSRRTRAPPRPDIHHEIGERGRKTGVSPPKNAPRGSNGFEDFGAYLAKATEMQTRDVQRELRKNAVVARNARKMSVATFVDDGEEDDSELYREDSMSRVLNEELRTVDRVEASSSKKVNGRPKDHGNTSADSDSSPIKTAHDSELADFDRVPGTHDRPKRVEKGKHKAIEPPDDESDANDGGGFDYDEGPSPDENDAGRAHVDQNDIQPLEDIPEEDENESGVQAGEAEAQRAKRKKPNSRPNPPPSSGVRRGDRQRLPRLDHWRGERVVYGRSVTPVGNLPVLGMVDVVRVPEDPTPPLSKHSRRAASRRIKSESAPPRQGDISVELDSETTPVGVVFSHTKQIEVRRRLVSTKRDQAERLKEGGDGANERFQFQRLFTESDFTASGILYIPVGKAKATKASKDNCYDFTVLRGHVSVTIHRTNFSVGPEGLVHVPRGNLYSLENVGDCVAKISFSQSRRIAAGSDPDEESDANEEPLDEGAGEQLQIATAAERPESS